MIQGYIKKLDFFRFVVLKDILLTELSKLNLELILENSIGNYLKVHLIVKME